MLADCGFNISENLALFGATLAIPSFTTGKSQLSQQEVECSQRLAKIRIHVERVIGHANEKQIYCITKYHTNLTSKSH